MISQGKVAAQPTGGFEGQPLQSPRGIALATKPSHVAADFVVQLQPIPSDSRGEIFKDGARLKAEAWKIACTRYILATSRAGFGQQPQPSTSIRTDLHPATTAAKANSNSHEICAFLSGQNSRDCRSLWAVVGRWGRT